MKNNIIVKFIILSSFVSCSTLKKTLVYSAASGAVGGSLIGRSLSPDRESKNFNTLLGLFSGAAISAAIGYFFWKDANPDLELKSPVIPDRLKPIQRLTDPLLSEDNISFPSGTIPMEERKYIDSTRNLPKDIRNHAKKQYYRRYKTTERKIENDNKVFVIPSYEIIENGIE